MVRDFGDDRIRLPRSRRQREKPSPQPRALASHRAAPRVHRRRLHPAAPTGSRRRSRVSRETKQAGIAFGSVIAADHDPKEWFIPAIRMEPFERYRGPVIRSLGLIGMGANMFVRQARVRQDWSLRRGSGPGGPLLTGEECELTYRALKHGLEVVREPALTVTHWGARPVSGDVATAARQHGILCGWGGLREAHPRGRRSGYRDHGPRDRLGHRFDRARHRHRLASASPPAPRALVEGRSGGLSPRRGA